MANPQRKRAGPALLLLALLTSCSATPPARTWEGRLARAQLLRAEESLASGDRERARELASDALLQARQAAQLDTLARSQLLLAQIDSDPVRLEDALTIFTELGDDEGLARALLARGALLGDSGQPGPALQALDEAEAALTRAALERPAAARIEARIHHRAARALSLQGLHDSALSRERRSALALTLVPERDERVLRRAVAQSLGDGYARLSDPAEAIRHHAEAASLARLIGDRRAELDAVEMLGRDLEHLGRLSDAVGHAARALELALALKEHDRAVRIAESGKALLRQIDEPTASVRWRAFQSAGG